MWQLTLWLIIMATKTSIIALAALIMSMFFGEFLFHFVFFIFSTSVFQWMIGDWNEARRIISEAGECK